MTTSLLPIVRSYHRVGSETDVVVTLERDARPPGRDFPVRYTITGLGDGGTRTFVIWGVEESDATRNAIRAAIAELRCRFEDDELRTAADLEATTDLTELADGIELPSFLAGPARGRR